MHHVDKYEWTALHHAAMLGSMEVVEALLKAIPAGDGGGGKVKKVDLADDTQSTSLMHAASFGHGDVVNRLLVAGANPAKKNRDGHTAADIAAERGHVELADIIRQRIQLMVVGSSHNEL